MEKIADGLVMEVFRAPGISSGQQRWCGALSGQTDQPSGLQACAQCHWAWRMTTEGRPGWRIRTAAAENVK